MRSHSLWCVLIDVSFQIWRALLVCCLVILSNLYLDTLQWFRDLQTKTYNNKPVPVVYCEYANTEKVSVHVCGFKTYERHWLQSIFHKMVVPFEPSNCLCVQRAASHTVPNLDVYTAKEMLGHTSSCSPCFFPHTCLIHHWYTYL